MVIKKSVKNRLSNSQALEQMGAPACYILLCNVYFESFIGLTSNVFYSMDPYGIDASKYHSR